MTEMEVGVLLDRMIPSPRKSVFEDGEFILENQSFFEIQTESGLVPSEWFADTVRRYWNLAPDFECCRKSFPDGRRNPEAYRICVSSEKVTIQAKDKNGLEHALRTLRQLAEPERGNLSFSRYLLPCCDIEDEPKLAFRGIHFCVFPETPIWFLEKQIRLAAYYKFNYAVIEPWGVFPYQSHPEFCWKDKAVSRSDFRRIADVAKEVGITLIPQLNLLGHAGSSRIGSGKHYVLDFHPELQPLFEPSGWCWCLTNPKTREIMSDLVTELHDFFGSPAYFHIGCDEADGLATCKDCRGRNREELVLEHIQYFHDLLGKRGARSIMWHDMLLLREDPRWAGYIVCGNKEHGLEKLYRKLPKDIVIADWQYGSLPESNRKTEWPTARFFQKEKFDVLVCPWMDAAGTFSLGKMAGNEKMFGMLETTWHTNNGHQFKTMFYDSACAAWGGAQDRPGTINRKQLGVGLHLRQVGWDMNLVSYEQTGDAMYQIPHETFQDAY